jgi:hypothetical protein
VAEGERDFYLFPATERESYPTNSGHLSCKIDLCIGNQVISMPYSGDPEAILFGALAVHSASHNH